jgi:opacity protein-like surface antigen
MRGAHLKRTKNMKKLLACLASAAALAVAAPAAAQPAWVGINQRQAQLDARIDAGVRDGSLTRAEATRLRAEFREIAALEGRYRASGGRLDASERADLDRRFDALSARIRVQRHDAQDRYGGPGGPGGWMSINQRQAQLDARIDAGVRDGTLSRGEAARLRAEFNQIAALEAQYRRTGGGLTNWERQDLDRRFDALSARIRQERADSPGGYRGGWWNINERQDELERRINAGLRDGTLTRAEAYQLRAQFRDIAALEARYRRTGGGLNAWERNDLNTRFDRLARRIRWERRDWDRRDD